jgi:hypothetical protein
VGETAVDGAVAKRSGQKKSAPVARRASTLAPIAADVTAIEPMSPPADALAVGVPPAARTRYEGYTEAIASAISSTAAAIEATTTAAKSATAAAAAASSAARFRRRGRSADQNGRGAGHVDEQQS